MRTTNPVVPRNAAVLIWVPVLRMAPLLNLRAAPLMLGGVALVLLAAVGAAWLLHDQYRVSWSVMIPSVLILLGGLMLLARSPRIPDKARSAQKSE